MGDLVIVWLAVWEGAHVKIINVLSRHYVTLTCIWVIQKGKRRKRYAYSQNVLYGSCVGLWGVTLDDSHQRIFTMATLYI